MRVAINCKSFLKKQYTGIGRYAYNLVKSLLEIDQESEYWLYAQKGLFDKNKNPPSFPARNATVKIDHFGRGLTKSLKGADIYHSPSLDFLDISQTKIIATVHDLVYKVYPDGHTQETCDISDRQLNEIVEKADKIICCSQSTMDDLEDFFPVEEDKLVLIHQGVDKNVFYPLKEEGRDQARAVLKSKGVEGKYIFFVGTIEPRKNLPTLLKAFAQLKKNNKFDGSLVVAGMRGWKNEGLEELISSLGIVNDVLFLGYVTNEELRCLYTQAEVFAFPSLYEGFGFPLVEAFSCGAAVVTSNVSSCPEIAGEAALTIDPHNPDVLAQAILRILEDEALKNDLIGKALKRAEKFSFLNTAKQTLDVYNEVYNSVPGKI